MKSLRSSPLRIGVSACFFHSDPKRPIFKGKTLIYWEQALSHWLLSQGVLAYLIPALTHDSKISLSEICKDLDGLVLQGGSDVAPESYGEKPLKPEWAGDRVRDLYEIELVKTFIAQKKPILGVCRGMQLLNVALGGTLYQDLDTQFGKKLSHRNWDIYDLHSHFIELENNSILSGIYKDSQKYKVNSIHHQGIKDLAPGLQVEAYATEDHLIEALRLEKGPWCLAMQWHPEFHDDRDSKWMNNAPLLKEFLKQAAKK